MNSHHLSLTESGIWECDWATTILSTVKSTKTTKPESQWAEQWGPLQPQERGILFCSNLVLVLQDI